MFRFVVLGSFFLAAMLALQGCGSGGTGTTLTTTATTTATSTSTSTRTAPGGLRYCEDISTFYRVNIDANGTKSAAGQCIPSQSPGAYYTKVGQKAQDGKSDLEWMCFNPTFDRSLWTNAQAQANGFEGACLFEEFESAMRPNDVEDCSQHLSHHPAVCAPGPDMFWGACWSSLSENWKCVPKGDPTISGLAKGDCKAQVLLENGAPTDSFYNGVCRFMKEKQKQYKCDTVPGYSASIANTCGGGGDGSYDKACFSLKSGANWQCFDKDTPFTTPCDWTLLPDGSKQFYTGACVFKGDEGYDDALDGHNLTETVGFRVIV